MKIQKYFRDLLKISFKNLEYYFIIYIVLKDNEILYYII